MSDIKRFDNIASFSAIHERDDGDYVLYTDHIAALEAVKATKVRALKWNFFDVPHDYGKGVYDANSEVGAYSIYISTNFEGEPFYCPKLSKQFTSLDETKAAAQADYAERILSAIVPSPALEANQQVVETLLERGQAFANQVRHVTYHLNGQAYSSTVSELGAFDAALRSAHASLSGNPKGEQDNG